MLCNSLERWGMVPWVAGNTSLLSLSQTGDRASARSWMVALQGRNWGRGLQRDHMSLVGQDMAMSRRRRSDVGARLKGSRTGQ